MPSSRRPTTPDRATRSRALENVRLVARRLRRERARGGGLSAAVRERVGTLHRAP